MPEKTLSILIPARNEMFLAKTIENILENMRGDTEIIAVCDGNWPSPPVKDHPKVTLIYHSESIGQRAATNEAAKLSRAKYVMKCDAHCAFGEGFDVIMMEDMQDDWTMVPKMYNLHAFDWVCKKCGTRRYQGPSGPCEKCGGETFRDILWKAKTNPESTSMRFDRNLKFQYWREYKDKQKGDLVETMSIIGACFMLTREKYWDLEICDEGHGSWGQQGTEVACKTWLSGGKLICNKRTWFAHMFRTQGGDFGFPYPIRGKDIGLARKYSHDLWFNNKWAKAKYPLSWLIEKFNPPEWEDYVSKPSVEETSPQPPPIEEPTNYALDVEVMAPKRGIVYYTDNRGDQYILEKVRKQILNIASDYDIVSASLKPLNFGRNIVLNEERGVLTMFKQILAALEHSRAIDIWFCEHDMLYHPSHFDFEPPRDDIFYYDENRWFVDAKTGRALFYHACSTSLLVAKRKLLLEHYRTRVARVEKEGFTLRLGYEPGNHPYPRGVDMYKRETYFAKYPSLDIRHGKNLTPTRWSKDQFRNKGNLYAWKESDRIDGWGIVKDRFQEILDAI